MKNLDNHTNFEHFMLTGIYLMFEFETALKYDLEIILIFFIFFSKKIFGLPLAENEDIPVSFETVLSIFFQG